MAVTGDAFRESARSRQYPLARSASPVSLTEVFVPLYAGRLIDAPALGPSAVGSAIAALVSILVFDRGRVVEEGDHEALMTRAHGHYRRLFDRQVGGIVSGVALVD